MDNARQAQLKEAGLVETTVEEFLGLSPAESALIEMRLALTAFLRKRRREMDLTQAALADLMKSSQSRVARIEAGAREVTLDLIFQAILATGATQADIAQVLGARA